MHHWALLFLQSTLNLIKISISSRTYYILYRLAFNDFFLSRYIYRAVTRARACVVRRSNVLECVSTMTRMFCSMHAGLLDGRCLGRRYRVSLEQLGALCGGCVCQRWDYYIYICIMYWQMTLALMRCEFVDVICLFLLLLLLFIYFFLQ